MIFCGGLLGLRLELGFLFFDSEEYDLHANKAQALRN